MLNPKDAAVLVWTDGEAPTIEHYQVPDGQAPETQGFFELGVALIVAVKGPPKPGKAPWIKVGGTLISPDKQGRLYESLKMGEDLHA